jgi:hypothetical protein
LNNATQAQVQDVLGDNNNRGGNNNPATNPPVVDIPGGGINIVNTACTQPSGV